MNRTQLVLALSAVTLSGCVNLGAVTDYAASASQVMSDKEAAIRWRDSEKKLTSMHVDGDVCPVGRSQRKPQADYDAAFTEAAEVHDTLAAYFKALGELASDKVPMPSQAVDGSLAAIKKVGVSVTANDEAALKAISAVLSRALDAYRQQKIREMMDATHEDVERVIGVLQALAPLYQDEVDGERIQAVKFIECSLSQGDITDKFWARREKQRVNAAYAAELQTMKTYSDALAKIKKDHEEIRKALVLDRDTLERTVKAIADTRKELDAAHQALTKL